MANDAIRRWHRHHKPVLQAVMKIGAFVDGNLVGAVTIEPPRAEQLVTPTTYEVTRLSSRGGGMW